MMEHHGKRPYESPLRAAQAAATRVRVLDAAQAVFIRAGFGRTSMAAIAREAGVSRETVYAAVGGKAALLKTVYDRAVAGDDESVAVLDRAAAQALFDDPNLERACADYGRATAGIVERLGPILVVMAGAPADAELAEVVTATRTERLVGSRRVLQGLARGPVPPAELDRAADVHWALVSPEVALLLVRDRGWSFERYATWVAEETLRQVRELSAQRSRS